MSFSATFQFSSPSPQNAYPFNAAYREGIHGKRLAFQPLTVRTFRLLQGHVDKVRHVARTYGVSARKVEAYEERAFLGLRVLVPVGGEQMRANAGAIEKVDLSQYLKVVSAHSEDRSRSSARPNKVIESI